MNEKDARCENIGCGTINLDMVIVVAECIGTKFEIVTTLFDLVLSVFELNRIFEHRWVHVENAKGIDANIEQCMN